MSDSAEGKSNDTVVTKKRIILQVKRPQPEPPEAETPQAAQSETPQADDVAAEEAETPQVDTTIISNKTPEAAEHPQTDDTTMAEKTPEEAVETIIADTLQKRMLLLKSTCDYSGSLEEGPHILFIDILYCLRIVKLINFLSFISR